MTARGLRNNNPGNIDYNPRNDWQGQLPPDLAIEQGFARFDSAENGIRALAKLLINYRGKDGMPGIGLNGIDTTRALRAGSYCRRRAEGAGMKLILIACLVTLSGCTVVSATSSAVDAYCATPNPARMANRILVNATIAPNSVAITCADEVAAHE